MGERDLENYETQGMRRRAFPCGKSLAGMARQGGLTMRFVDEECGRCRGSGEEDCMYCGGRGTDSAASQECRVCHGTGKQPCTACHGTCVALEDEVEA
jgi:hypothetical protein